jgi:hypothetical protein
METYSYRTLIFPPIVLSILICLFYSFGVFEVLLNGNENTRQDTISASRGSGDLSASHNLSPNYRP